jgi:NDP-sugar pyrophosphorylase family protein
VLPVVVLAGGLGHRLRPITGDTIPKVLAPVRGRPFLDYKLAGLAAAGADRVVLLVGHHGDQIAAHVGDGTRLGLTVECIDDGPALRGTGGAIAAALPRLPDAFWVTYGDTLLDVDVPAAEAQFVQEPSLLALMTVLHNRGRFEPSNVRVDGPLVAAYAKRPPPPGGEHIDYGMLAFRQHAFAGIATRRDAFDLADVLTPLVAAGRVGAFAVTERFHDVGTVAALRETEAFLASVDPDLV